MLSVFVLLTKVNKLGQVRPWAPAQNPIAITSDLIAPFSGLFCVQSKVHG